MKKNINLSYGIDSHDCGDLESQNLMGWQAGDTGKSGNVNPKTVCHRTMKSQCCR